MIWWRCPGAFVHDGWSGEWWRVGNVRTELPGLVSGSMRGAGGYSLELSAGLASSDRRQFQRAVDQAVEYIRAGDVFQVNLSHSIRTIFSGSTRALFADLAKRARPWYGAYIEDLAAADRHAALVSISPELFLEFDSESRKVVTRPIKGTRGADLEDHALAASQKDAAELAMIVDLMRNDLGRVCEFGSIRVTQPRVFERHGRAAAERGSGGVLHGVATIEGRVRKALDIEAILSATFPAGSITGAPKVRAMQIIDELESPEHVRGPYTGSIGYISDGGHACFNVAIRTALVTGERDSAGTSMDAVAEGKLVYAAGAGIVADSTAAAEWDETLTKSELILELARRDAIRVPGGANSLQGKP